MLKMGLQKSHISIINKSGLSHSALVRVRHLSSTGQLSIGHP